MKDDKKKFMILGLLGLVIVSVGAFQFMGGSGSAPVSGDKKPKASPSAAPATDAPKNPGVAQPLAERDPFAMPKEAQPTPEATPTPPPAARTASTQPRSHMPRGTDHMPPALVDGPGGSLPGTLDGGIGGPGGKAGPAALTVEPTFGYSVVGTVLGNRPCAVLADSQGNQRLVPLGGSVDSDTKVTGIEKGRVTVQFHGKTLHFEMGGNPSAK